MNNIKTKIVILTALAALAAGCRNKELEAFNAIEKDRFLVKTEKTQARDIEDYLTLVGSVKAMDEATLYPRVAGKLLKNLVTEGDKVTKDQAVALVERDEPGVVYEPAPVPSTLNGVIGRVYQDSGANVTPQTPIALVVSQDRVRVVIDVPERYVGKVFLGQAARIKVDAYPDSAFYGKVYRVSPVVNTQTRSAAVEILTDNSSGRLKSGMFSEIKLVTGSRSGALSVPAAAIVDEDGKTYVFTAAGGNAARRAVKTGITDGNYTQVVSGLRNGEEVVTFGLYGLKDGSKIKVQQD